MKGVHWIDAGQWPPAIALTADRRSYQAFMRKYCGGKASDHPPFPPPNGALCQQMTKSNGCMFLIAVGPVTSRDELACSLAHEATHLMRWLFEYIDEKQPGTEAQAYLVEHIVRHGLRALP